MVYFISLKIQVYKSQKYIELKHYWNIETPIKYFFNIILYLISYFFVVVVNYQYFKLKDIYRPEKGLDSNVKYIQQK